MKISMRRWYSHFYLDIEYDVTGVNEKLLAEINGYAEPNSMYDWFVYRFLNCPKDKFYDLGNAIDYLHHDKKRTVDLHRYRAFYPHTWKHKIFRHTDWYNKDAICLNYEWEELGPSRKVAYLLEDRDALAAHNDNFDAYKYMCTCMNYTEQQQIFLAEHYRYFRSDNGNSQKT